VTLSHPERKPTGRRRKHPVPSVSSVAAAELIEARPEAFRTISWRTGTKGPLKAAFAAMRVQVADGPVAAGGQHLPGEEVWLIGEHRATGERKYYLSNLPAETSLETLAALIKARWACEQMHQQMKDELGLDHFEGRSWRGLPPWCTDRWDRRIDPTARPGSREADGLRASELEHPVQDVDADGDLGRPARIGARA
jgi:SRSO17 transposase